MGCPFESYLHERMTYKIPRHPFLFIAPSAKASDTKACMIL